MFETTKVRAVFEDFNAFKETLKTLHESGFNRVKAYGPTNLEEVEEYMPVAGSPVRAVATTGAIIGLILFYLMCALTSLIYKIIVGGKPPISNIPYVIPAYEGTILVGSIFAFLAGLFFAALGPHKPPQNYDPAFSENRYGIDVMVKPWDRDRVIEMMKSADSHEVEEGL